MKKMPNYEKSYLKFNFKEVSKEARSAARSLARDEEKPSQLNREALRNFSFSKYFDKLSKIAPTITTTLIAASSQSKFRDIKVQCTVHSRVPEVETKQHDNLVVALVVEHLHVNGSEIGAACSIQRAVWSVQCTAYCVQCTACSVQ